MKLILPLLAVALLGACASAENTAKEPFVEREYPTGSNLPRRADSAPPAVSTADREAVERMRDQQILPPPRSSGAAGGR